MNLRFAPTLESELHIGNFRVLIANYVYAMKNNLNIVFRVDQKNKVNKDIEIDMSNKVISMCKTLGITFSHTIFQSDRHDLYFKVLNVLIEQKKVYLIDEIYYMNFEGLEFSEFYDHVFGNCRKAVSLIKNPVIYDKSRGMFFYNFTSVVDDIFEKISIVIRGGDHIENTFTQILMINIIKNAMSIDHNIEFAHIPLCLKADGSKISKTQDIEMFRISYVLNELKLMPITLIQYLLMYSISSKKTLSSLITTFEWKLISTAPRRINFDELKKVNRKFLNNLELNDLYLQLSCIGFIFEKNLLSIFAAYCNSIEELCIVKTNVEKLINSIDGHRYVFNMLVEEDQKKFITNITNHKGFENEYLKYIKLFNNSS